MPESLVPAFDAAVTKLRSMRAAGVPIFTKDAIRKVYDQIKNRDTTVGGYEIKVEDLTGREISFFTMKQGQSCGEWCDPDVEFVRSVTFLMRRSMRH